MKINIKDFVIDTTQGEFEDCFDFSDVIYEATQRAKNELKDKLKVQLTKAFLEDDKVKDYIKKAKENMAKNLEGKEYEPL